jgi:tetratricopeptide (TPR) repeat protein
MKRWAWLLAAALLAVPAAADDKKKDEKKGKEAPAGQAAPAQDAVKEAEAKLAAGDTDGAIGVLEKGLGGLGPAAGEAGLRLGRLRESRGELDLAVDAYKAAAAKLSGPAKGEALGRMAVAQDTRGMADAAASAEAAAAADPEGVWPAIALSYRRAHEGKPDEGVALAQKALAAGGGAGAQSALGHALEAKGDMGGSEAAYRAAVAADASALAPVIGLATVLRKTGRAGEAEPLLKKVIDSSPGAVEAYKEMARVKMALGRAQEALSDASIAAAMSENDPEAQRLVVEVKVARSLQALGQGQTDLAVQDLTQLRDQNPESAEVRLGLARAQVARRDGDGALAELAKAAELDPKNAEVQYQLGWVNLVMKGKPAAAVPPLERAVALDPGNVPYRTTLGAALSGIQSFDRAIEELGKVTGAAGYDKAEGFIYLGQAYVGAKKYKEAVAALEKATALAPNSDQAWAFLGWAYFGLKDAANFTRAAGKARSLGYKEATLLQYLKRVEGGEAIK